MWNGYGYPGGMMGYDGGWYWWMALHGVMFLAVVALIAIGVAVAIRFLTRADAGKTHTVSGGDGGRQSALGILDSRYARGEVDREEYLQKKKDLM